MKAFSSFVNSVALTSYLYKMLHFYMDKKKGTKLRVTTGEDSYTDGRLIVLGLPMFFRQDQYPDNAFGRMMNKQVRENGTKGLYTLLFRILLAHEVQHINSSSFSMIKELIEDGSVYLQSLGVHERVGKKVSQSLMNILEDGRIEMIAVNKLPGLKQGFILLNQGIRYQGAIEKIAENETEEYLHFISQILSYAKTGYYAPGIDVYSEHRLMSEFSKIANIIDRAVTAETCRELRDLTMELIKTSGPYIAELLSKASENQNAIDELMNQLGEMMSEWTTDEEKEFNTGGEGAITIRRVPSKAQKKPADGKDEPEEESSSGQGASEKGEEDDGEEGSGETASEEGGSEEDEAETDGSESDGEEGDNASADNEDGSTQSDGSGEDEAEGEKGDKDGSKSEFSEKPPKDGDNIKSEGSEDGAFDDIDPMSEGWTDEEIEEMEEFINSSSEAIEREEASARVSEQNRQSELSDKEVSEIIDLYQDDYYATYREEVVLVPSDPLPIDIYAKGQQLKRAMERILFVRCAHERGLRRGTLDPTALWKVGALDDRIFEKKADKNRSFAFFLLQDGSGSMSGEKELESAKALAMIEEGLKDFVSMKISTFNVGDCGVTHYTAKGFNDNSHGNKSYNFLKVQKASGGNKDGFSIRVAAKELLKRPERTKVLIVLSDGLPSDYKGGYEHGRRDVKDAVRDARKNGILVIAIRFGDASWMASTDEEYKFMYEKDYLACKPNEIFQRLLNVVQTILR
jgi:hypothetical protein